MSKKTKKVAKIGGQAVLEGVMMRGEHSMATAVRDEWGEIVVESERIISPKEKNKLFGLPIIRGIVAFFDSLIKGTKILLKSAEVYGADMGEPSKFEKWLAEKTRIKVLDIAIFLGLVFGLGLSLGLFLILPQIITGGIIKLFSLAAINSIYKNLIAGVIKILIFVGYILLVSMLNDIKRTFMYHGAEHKVISCYEHDLELTVENCKKMSTKHDRCGTTFIFIVMIISIIAFSFLGWDTNVFLRIITRLALLPFVAGISYEILRLLAKTDFFLVKIFKMPGLFLQKITTKEPTDDMLEVALVAFKTVQELENNQNMEESKFNIKKDYKAVRSEMKDLIKDITSEESDIDWILCSVLNKKRSELPLTRYINNSDYIAAIEYAKARASGRPLQYVLGNTEFYGLTLMVNESVLIPRFDTEILVEKALPYCNGKVLDLCTGSGAIALAIKANSTASVTASDISEAALSIAKANAKQNNLEVEFIISDLFSNIQGQFDVIIVNPPYIKTSDISNLHIQVKDYEPMLALDGGADGLVIIKTIINQAHRYLADNGVVFMEIGIGQASDVEALFTRAGYSVEIIKDLNGIDRILKAVRNV